jgi:hypothetical protein
MASPFVEMTERRYPIRIDTSTSGPNGIDTYAQADEWEETWGLLDELLSDRDVPPLDRLRRVVVTFFHSEREEAGLRVALDDAGALFRDAPEAKAHVAKARRRVQAFVDEAVPGASAAEPAFAADFVMNTMAAVAERITAQGRSRAEVERWGRTTGDVLCRYLQDLWQ